MELLIYFLRVSACMAIFYVLYVAGLRRLTFFRVNRLYLLFSLAISFVIPVVQFTIVRDVPTDPEGQGQLLQQVVVSDSPYSRPDVVMDGMPGNFVQLYWENIILIVYIGVSLVLLIIAVKHIWWLVNYARGQEGSRVSGMKVMTKTTGFTNCSFFHYVFVDDSKLSEQELQVILSHEAVHVKQWHSIDKVLLAFLKAILWFNPLIYLYDRALEEVNEFDADARSSSCMGLGNYADMLLRQVMPKIDAMPVHHMAEHPVKTRIKMLFNPKSNKMKGMMYLSAVPACLSLIWLLSVEIVSAQHNDNGVIHAAEIVVNTNEPAIVNRVEEHQLVEAVSQVQEEELAGVDTVKDGVLSDKRTVNQHNIQVVYDTLYTAVQLRMPAEETNSNGCRVIGVSSDEEYTIVSFEHTASSDRDWVLLNKEIYIQANNDMKHFRYVKSENIPLKPERHRYTKAGEKLRFKVYFEKIPDNAKAIDIIERAGEAHYFNFYGLQLAALNP